MTKPSEAHVKEEIEQMHEYLLKHRGEDVILERMIYTVAETLRWSIEDTTGWGRPLKQVINNVNILKRELKEKK